jgi:hypothetical protein
MSKRRDDSKKPKPGSDSAGLGGSEGATAPGAQAGSKASAQPSTQPSTQLDAPADPAITGGMEAGSTACSAGTDGEPATEGRDVLFAYSKTESGDGFRVIRSRDDRIELGEVRELRDSKPVHGDIVKLSPVAGQDKLYDVEVLMEGPKTRSTSGPVRVSNEGYRQQWEAIFGSQPSTDPSELN